MVVFFARNQSQAKSNQSFTLHLSSSSQDNQSTCITCCSQDFLDVIIPKTLDLRPWMTGKVTTRRVQTSGTRISFCRINSDIRDDSLAGHRSKNAHQWFTERQLHIVMELQTFSR
ncbi:hypothetical protein [Oryza sativa Japonica Group]|uniref:p0696G06.17 protein n=1 Tax=Oryza sativa subsp. japonica TaxID=39947 RepID=Q8S0J5_ORYSJ|nr:hypothetical protein [Oryza sativa Japonica Group]BAC06260.1 P0696G06.17 [Oryza sativa Japonica Group]